MSKKVGTGGTFDIFLDSEQLVTFLNKIKPVIKA